MKQQLELLKKVKTIPKLSEILREVHTKGIQKCENYLKKGDAFCARGILIKNFGEEKGYKLNNEFNYVLSFSDSTDKEINTIDLEDELFANSLYNKKWDQLEGDEYSHIREIQHNLTNYNDSSPNITFLDCANFLEKFGL
jgi:hypothetical protein